MARKLFILLLLAIGAAVRLWGINSQLWLDEIWSIHLSQNCRSAMDVFTLHHDNNHWLNTLWIYSLGPGRAWWLYHIPAELAGFGTVVMGWLIARRRGYWPGIAALAILGGSEFLIEFSSEARGYALLGFFSLACVWLLEIHLQRPRRWTACAMAGCGVLGVLSHLSFVVILAGLIGASLVWALSRQSRAVNLGRMALWWAVPVAALGILTVVDVIHMERGGGPSTPADLPSESAAMILGIPLGNRAAPVAGILALGVCAIQIGHMMRRREVLWPVYAAAFGFVPIVLYVIPRGEYLHPRYLYASVPLLMLALAMQLACWCRGTGKWIVTAILAGFVAMNVATLLPFLKLGRGDYLGAAQAMTLNTPGPNLVVAAFEHPASTVGVAQYYENYALGRAKEVDLFLGTPTAADSPQWLISETDRGLRLPVPGQKIVFERRQGFYKGSVTSGVDWFLYERAQ